EHHREELEKAGLFFEPFGEQTYVIRSHPTWFPKGFAEEIIREMVAQIITNATVDIETIREDAAILMSCKRSIKANHYLKDRKSTRLNSSHVSISYAVFCLKKKYYHFSIHCD